MEKATMKPKVHEGPDGSYAVSVGDEITIRWWKRNGTWSVEIKSAQGMDVTGVRHEKATVSLH
jgi:hypothetical protein